VGWLVGLWVDYDIGARDLYIWLIWCVLVFYLYREVFYTITVLMSISDS